MTPLLVLLAFLQGSSYLASIELAAEGVASPRIVFSDLSEGTILHGSELGEMIEGRTLVLHPKRGRPADFKVYFQFETSLTVRDEGAHLDLLDWKHHTSEWQPVPGDTLFSIPFIGSTAQAQFPPATAEEVYRAVSERGGERWAGLVAKRFEMEYDPVAVGVSKIRLRITALDRGREHVLHTINFTVPLGC